MINSPLHFNFDLVLLITRFETLDQRHLIDSFAYFSVEVTPVVILPPPLPLPAAAGHFDHLHQAAIQQQQQQQQRLQQQSANFLNPNIHVVQSSKPSNRLPSGRNRNTMSTYSLPDDNDDYNDKPSPKIYFAEINAFFNSVSSALRRPTVTVTVTNVATSKQSNYYYYYDDKDDDLQYE